MYEEIYDIYTVVRETGEVIRADDDEWCIKSTLEPGKKWLYRFEDMKGESSPDYDYNDPILQVEKLNGSIKITIMGYSGIFHSDIYAYDSLLWLGVGGIEKNHVGDSIVLLIPVLPPPVPPPVELAPPGWSLVTNRLDTIIEKLSEIRPIPINANAYRVIDIKLALARPIFQLFNIHGFAITIYKCTGEMELAIGTQVADGISIESIVYPQMLVIDKMDFDKFYVKNSAQPEKEATLIIWRRE